MNIPFTDDAGTLEVFLVDLCDSMLDSYARSFRNYYSESDDDARGADCGGRGELPPTLPQIPQGNESSS